ncbi:ankyrin repeat-containing domain protein, partial [Ochromonadaceae sp. CCMP2298]
MRPIHWAASDGKLRSVKFLLEHRQDVNALDGNSCTPLIIAAQYGRVEMVVYLSKNGADLGQQDSPLHLAALRGNAEVVHYLIDKCGANTTTKDKNGCTPLMLA